MMEENIASCSIPLTVILMVKKEKNGVWRVAPWLRHAAASELGSEWQASSKRGEWPAELSGHCLCQCLCNTDMQNTEIQKKTNKNTRDRIMKMASKLKKEPVRSSQLLSGCMCKLL